MEKELNFEDKIFGRTLNTKQRYHLGKGIVEDLKQRVPYYLSDFFDGFVGEKTLQVRI